MRPPTSCASSPGIWTQVPALPSGGDSEEDAPREEDGSKREVADLRERLDSALAQQAQLAAALLQAQGNQQEMQAIRHMVDDMIQAQAEERSELRRLSTELMRHYIQGLGPRRPAE